MARFASELIPELLWEKIQSLDGEKVGDHTIRVEVNDWDVDIAFWGKDKKKEDTQLACLKGTISEGRKSASVLTGRYSLPLKVYIAVPIITAAVVLALVLPSDFLDPEWRPYDLPSRASRDIFWAIRNAIHKTVLVVYGPLLGSLIVAGLMGVVALLLLLSNNFNVECQANKKLLHTFLTDRLRFER